HLRELLDDAAEWIGWGRSGDRPAPGHARGKGLACGIKSTIPPTKSAAAVDFDSSGVVKLLTSSVEMGQGVGTALARIAAERLSVPELTLLVSTPDTSLTPYDQQTSSSRSTHAMG